MNIIYRLATPEDAYGVEYVSAHSWKETYQGLVPDDYLDNRVNRIETFDEERINKTKKFLSNASNYYVALDGEKVVGILYVKDNLEEYSGYGHLGAMYLLKEYQGYGIGKNLFRIAIETMINMGYNKMQTECMQGNKTITFYEKYNGHIVNTIDFPINKEINVKADVLLFENIKEILNELV